MDVEIRNMVQRLFARRRFWVVLSLAHFWPPGFDRGHRMDHGFMPWELVRHPATWSRSAGPPPTKRNAATQAVRVAEQAFVVSPSPLNVRLALTRLLTPKHTANRPGQQISPLPPQRRDGRVLKRQRKMARFRRAKLPPRGLEVNLVFDVNHDG